MAEAQAIADAFCVTGSVLDGDQDTFLWQVERTSQWSLALQGMPGQDARLQLFELYFAEDGTTATQAKTLVNLDGASGVTTPAAALLPGRYSLLVSSDSGSLIYRLSSVETAAPVAAAGPVAEQSGAFALVAAGANEIVVPWSLDTQAATARWTLSVTAPLGAGIVLQLRDEAGIILASASAADPAGTVLMADLGLAPGAYHAMIFGAPPDAAIAVGARAEGSRHPATEEEPNDDPDAAFPISAGVAVGGRLIGGEDTDCFALEVDPDSAGDRFDAVVRAPGAAALTLALLAEDQSVLQQRSGAGAARMADVTLDAGRHVFCVSGALPETERYSLALERRGPGLSSAELEPNDTPATANPLPADGTVFGLLTGDDVDYFRLPVDGDPQLWLIQAAGEGLDRVALHDAAGLTVVELRSQPGDSVLRLPDTPLLSGIYVIEVAGSDGRYLLRAAPIGPAGATSEPGAVPELEPNGTIDTAMALGWDRPVEGTLVDGEDNDVFRLSLAAVTHVRLQIALQDSITLQGALSWGSGGLELARFNAWAGDADTTELVWSGVLQPGDHYVTLAAYDAAGAKYRLLAERRPYFDPPVDREPNDGWWLASPLPPDGRLVGTLTSGDTDWYRLPALTAPGEIVVRSLDPESVLEFASLQVVEAVETGSWPLLDSVTAATLSFDGEAWRAPLPAAADLFLSIQAAEGPYDALVVLADEPPAPPVAPPAVTAALAFPADAPAAFSGLAQSLTGSLRLVNTGASPLELSLDGHVGDARWTLAIPDGPIALAAGAEAVVPVAIAISAQVPDDGPVPVEIAVRDASGGQVIAAATLAPVRGASPVSPRRDWPFPDALLGGINVAWSAFGAVSLDGGPLINDGFVTANGTASYANYELASLQPTLELAGDQPVDLLGFVLHPGSLVIEERLREFSIELSVDGITFSDVLSGTLSPLPVAQAFALPAPVPARFVRLVPLSSQGSWSYVALAELQAIAAPDALPAELLVGGSPDIARPELGGRVVWRTPEHGADQQPAEVLKPAEQVLGFLHGRAALITAIRWEDDPATPPEARAAGVEISASLDGPQGPWQPVGAWALSGTGESETLTFPAPVWARYLHIAAVPAPGQASLVMPPHVPVVEAPVDGRYRSVLGIWHEDDPAASYEWLHPETPSAAAAQGSGTGSRPLALGEMATGAVHGVDSRDRYLVAVPPGLDRLGITIGEPIGERVGVALLDTDDRPVTLDRMEATADATYYEASVAEGTVTIEVFQAPASVAVLWDTSGSVQQMQPVVRAALADLIRGLDPAAVAVNLFPFRGEPGPLLSDFTTDRRLLSQALDAYDWQDSSSDAELVLLTAANALFERIGARAIVLFTDGENDVSPLTLELWRRLGVVRPMIASLLMPSIVSSEDRWRPLSLVRDWSLVGGGFDMAVAYAPDPYAFAWRRLFAALDRPAAYSLTVGEPQDRAPAEPAFGYLVLERGDEPAQPLAAQGSVQVLLDVSGSMLQRTADGRRIAVAQATLTRLVDSLLPPGTPFALRLFGQGQSGSCDTTLAVPPGPLDPIQAAAAIASLAPVDGARTPIGEALRLVAEDMAALPAPRLVVMVTDGEETCDGDPRAEIERLRADGFEVRINILGFAVDDAALADDF
ncbi:MAG: VWA domain-containing protein, partial [Alphaproteobacteria bacterium]